ncbi:hypothetical protein [Bosea sp. UNC402CLCol]|uniref:hypothetical protein n=1 Tax=Bosea sp. UNC402CLCol TaxID=1510531 RepID=UPI00056E6CE1|nr:hypothetical protein [Bosea sp. UNC402CLCol]
MTIDGLPHRYQQGAARRFRLDAAALRVIRGYASRDGRLEDVQRLEAEARIVGGALRRAGLDGAAGRLRLTLRPLATSSEAARLLLLLGYRDENGEAEPFAEGFLAPSVFEALKADILSGLAQELSLEATTSLWIREEDRDTPAGQPVDWYLGPAADGQGSAPARGFIESIEWCQAAAAEAPDPAGSEPTAPLDHAESEDPHLDDSADQLRRINWSLKQLLLILAFMLIIIAMK